jgi:hypothetical protein
MFASGFNIGDVLAEGPGDIAVNSNLSTTNDSPQGFRLNVSAFVQLIPVITGLSQMYGSAAGGTPVTISGRNFNGTKSVTFGTTRATSFKVVSDKQINAVSPAGTAGTTVDVHVTTAGGTSKAVAADHFRYA